MQQLPEEIQFMFFEVFNEEISIEDFEKWLYGNKELEKQVGESLYLDLISINYKEPHSRYEMQKLVTDLLDWGRYQELKLRKTLNALQTKDADFVNALVKSYDLYCDGYNFMEDIAMGFGLNFGVDYGFHLREGVLTAKELAYIEKFSEDIATKAAEVLALLDTNKIVIEPRNEELDERLIRYSYQDNRTTEEITKQQILKVEKEFSQVSFLSKLKRLFKI